MQVLIRRYRIRSGGLDAVARHARQGLLRELRQVPGFHSFYLVHDGGDLVTSVAVYQAAEGAALADRVCDDWFRADWPTFRAVTPEPTVGEALVADLPAVEAATPEERARAPLRERRNGEERRRWQDRRRGTERRGTPLAAPALGG